MAETSGVTAVSNSQQRVLIKREPDLYQPMDNDEREWERSVGANQGVFNCTWRPKNVTFTNGIMMLKLRKESGGYPYSSGEYKTAEEKYSYGYYEVRMKAAKGAGLMAGSFFTYSGVYGQRSHNEIDFEVLGYDPRKVQLNYYYAGTGKDSEHIKLVDLGFDASADFHNYGFRWSKESIVWYVDGKAVYKATKDIPAGPCKIMVNFWPGTSEVSGWLGGVYRGAGSEVRYDWIKYLNLSGQSEDACSIPASEKEAKPAETSNAPAGSSGVGEKNLDEFPILTRAGFNGASGGVSGGMVDISGSSIDSGYTLFFKETLSGKLCIKPMSGSGEVLLIKAAGPSRWKEDKVMKQFSVNTSAGYTEIDIPAGTNKINFNTAGMKAVVKVK